LKIRGELVLLWMFAASASATSLEVGKVELVPAGSSAPRAVRCEVSWKNGWTNARNHDAAWLFVKISEGPGGEDLHVPLAAKGHTAAARPGSPPPRLEVSADRVGALLYGAAPFRGDARFTVELALDPKAVASLDPAAKPIPAVFGLEMVLVPEGAFWVGDPDPAALDFAALYRVGPDRQPAGPFEVGSEDPIRIGPEPGKVDYRAPHPENQGDRLGPVPAAYPKGYRAFYLMKYELTQGEYAAFLNTLDAHQTASRAIHGGRGYADSRGTIALRDGRYEAGAPRRPANFVSWDDGAAFADWAGLRPMTDLEFFKACRGPGAPIAHEFPWGTASKTRLRRVVAKDDDLVTTGEADESLLSDATRDVLGASYWWVLDLAGSVWEKVVTLGHPAGRAFRGTHGDGEISPVGYATNEDWPRGDDNRGGYGYLGGGFYEQGMRETEFNPHSPIAYRRYGSWGGAPRSLAYGFRAARTAGS
jgi:formylglycine-generating enzyme required for sulfatase activity